MQGVPIRQKILHERDGGFFFLSEIFGFIGTVCCGADMPCCALYFFVHTAHQKKKISTYPTYLGYVRTYGSRQGDEAYVASELFSPGAWRGTLGITKSPVCNYDHRNTIFNHGPRSAPHRSLIYFSVLSERSGRRRPPAERSALYIRT